jgi:phenolic acid decarboxylase
MNSLLLNEIPLTNHEIMLYPNPSESEIYISKLDIINNEYQIINENGSIVSNGIIHDNKITISNLEKGIYLLKISNIKQIYKFIKK